MLNWIKQMISQRNPAKTLQQVSQIPITQIAVSDKATKPAESGKDTTPLRFAKLIMVTAQNNNKFYEMQENKDGSFSATYGRVGSAGKTLTYTMDEWDSKYREKIRKGYKDQARLFGETKLPVEDLEIEDKVIAALMSDLMKFARRSISYNYMVTAEEVSEKQVEEAQKLLDSLVERVKVRMKAKYFNDKLLELFQVIPRRMAKVSDHLIQYPKDAAALEAIRAMLAKEQETLDIMRQQVELNQQKNAAKEQKEKRTLLESMGLEVKHLEDKALIKTIRKMMGEDASKFHRAYQVVNVKTQYAFDKYMEVANNKKTELFWHGSRNENWLSIMQNGLVLRPANAIISGKMFGYGLYFADKFAKSLNYSSLYGSYWAGGTQNRAFLALYDVHVGKQMKIKKHQDWCCRLNTANLKKRGADYDSLFAKGGADLINNEYIVYNEKQCTIRYLVELKS